MNKPKRKPITDTRAGLQGFIEFLTGGKGSPKERGAVQRHAEQRLGPAAKFLIGIIEGLPEDTQETALLSLRDALACSYMIGRENALTAVKYLHAADMRDRPRREKPESRIIREAVERNCTNGKKPSYKAIISDAQPKLEALGCKLSDKAVRERAARMPKKPRP